MTSLNLSTCSLETLRVSGDEVTDCLLNCVERGVCEKVEGGIGFMFV
jgi:hypothetical protein